MKRIESWVIPNIAIKESEIGGKGMFAKERISEGEEVVRWGGEYVTKIEAEEGKSIARIACMHRLATIIYRILTQQRAYEIC